MFTLVKMCKQACLEKRDQDAVELSWKLTEFLSETAGIPEEVNKIKDKAVSAHLNLGELDKAVQWLGRLEAFGVDVLLIKQKLLEMKRLQRGIPLENLADTSVLNTLGGLHKDLKAYDQAYKLYKKSFALDNTNFVALNGLGGICRKLNRYKEGIGYYKKALALASKPENKIVSLVGLGGIYRDLEMHTEAIKVYKLALGINGKDRYAHNGLGAVYFDLGRFNEGQAHFWATKDIRFLFKLFKRYKRKKMRDKAEECLRTILRIDPNNRTAKYLLGI